MVEKRNYVSNKVSGEKMETKNSRANGIKKQSQKTKTLTLERNNTKNLFVWIALGSFILIVAFLSITTYPVLLDAYHSVHYLKNEVLVLRSAMNTDSVRQFHLQKVLQLIRYHNPALDSEQAYDIANVVHEMSIKYTNLNVDMLCAVITHESANSWDPRVVSPAGAMGLMQIMPVTGMFLARHEEINWSDPEEVLFNPVYNIRMGARFLSSLLEKYDFEGALAAYNGGERMASKWIASGRDEQYLYRETRGYIPAIQDLYTRYRNESVQ